jgi:hypothetical protein
MKDFTDGQLQTHDPRDSLSRSLPSLPEPQCQTHAITPSQGRGLSPPGEFEIRIHQKNSNIFLLFPEISDLTAQVSWALILYHFILDEMIIDQIVP